MKHTNFFVKISSTTEGINANSFNTAEGINANSFNGTFLRIYLTNVTCCSVVPHFSFCLNHSSAFSMLMDKNQLHHYIISNYTKRQIDGFNKVWFERKKSIALPRHLVIYEK